MGLLEGWQRPLLGLQPVGVPFGPGLLRRGEAATVAEQEFRETLAGAQQIDADVFVAPQEITGRLLLLGGNVMAGCRGPVLLREALDEAQHRWTVRRQHV